MIEPQANASAIRAPVKSMGSVLGSRTARNNVQRLAPSARAASTRRRSTMRTAWLALTMNGNVAAYDTTNKAALPRTPSHRIAIGIHAIGAIERKPSSTGRSDTVERTQRAHGEAQRNADRRADREADRHTLQAAGHRLEDHATRGQREPAHERSPTVPAPAPASGLPHCDLP